MKLSIILPVYNSGNYLIATIDSLINQGLKDYEIIIVDDGSTDGTPKYCKEIASSNPSIKLYEQKNSGICAARNLGLSKATGDYIAFCDHDDLYCPYFLSKYMSLLEDEKDIDVIKFSSRMIIVDINGRMEKSIDNTQANTIVKNEFNWNSFALFYSSAEAVWNGIYKRELILQNQIYFNEKIKFGLEDICFCLCLFPYINKIAYVQEIGYEHYKRITHSTSAKFNYNRIESSMMIWNKMSGIIGELKGETNKEIVCIAIFDVLNGLTGQFIHDDCNLPKNTINDILDEFYKNICSNAIALDTLKHVHSIDISKAKKVMLQLFYRRKYSLMINLKKIYKLVF